MAFECNVSRRQKLLNSIFGYERSMYDVDDTRKVGREVHWNRSIQKKKLQWLASWGKNFLNKRLSFRGFKLCGRIVKWTHSFFSPEDGNNMFNRNVGIFLHVYTASQPRTRQNEITWRAYANSLSTKFLRIQKHEIFLQMHKEALWTLSLRVHFSRLCRSLWGAWSCFSCVHKITVFIITKCVHDFKGSGDSNEHRKFCRCTVKYSLLHS